MNETISGVPVEVLQKQIEEILDLPVEGEHEMGWRYPANHPLTGRKERYLKKGGTLAALFGYVTMVIDDKGVEIFGEESREVNNQIGRMQEALADRPDKLVSEKQVKLARKFGEMTLAIVEGNRQGATNLWQEIREKVSEKKPA